VAACHRAAIDRRLLEVVGIAVSHPFPNITDRVVKAERVSIKRVAFGCFKLVPVCAALSTHCLLIANVIAPRESSR